MLEFQLFRIKVIFPVQPPLWPIQLTRAEILQQMILKCPSAQLIKGTTWHIGNVEMIDESGLYFRFGRTTTTTVEVFEEGNFLDQEFEAAPYTHVLLDLDLEVCAIAKKTRLSPRTLGIARQLVRLFQSIPSPVLAKIRFEIDEINDPEDFIQHLRSAYTISRFIFCFSSPNPWDVEKDFVEPFQEFVREANGQQGKTEVKGEQLNVDVLEKISRSVATTGDEAIAWLKYNQHGNYVKKLLRGNPVVFQYEDLAETVHKKSLLDQLRDLYQHIRRIQKE